MSWQRIDENTYIDNTLVTCAEYQLFIDEMREDGKYFRPDHWTSHQFPAGQAREPILGIRHLDAIAFCDWLSKRDNGEWHYRLPRPTEAVNFPVIMSGKSYSYWTLNLEGQLSRATISPIRVIEINPNYDICARDIDPDITHIHDDILALIHKIDPSYENSLERTLNDIHTYVISQVHARVRKNFLDQARLIDNELDKDTSEENPHKLSTNSILAQRQSRDRLRTIALKFDVLPEPDINNDHTLAYVYSLDPAIASKIDLFLEKIISREFLAVDGTLDCIRLVKERTK